MGEEAISVVLIVGFIFKQFGVGLIPHIIFGVLDIWCIH